MNEFQFKPEIAERYGVNEAIFLHSLSFWLMKNRSNRKNFHDGRYWSYDTYKAIAERFPFWTVRQVERIVASCETQGAILVGNYNIDKTDRTKWYTLAGDAEVEYLPKTVCSNSPDGVMTEPQGIDGNTPNGEMGVEPPLPFTQTVKSIKETVTTGTKPPISPKGEGERKKKDFPQDVRGLLNEYVGNDRDLADAMKAFMAVRSELGAKQTARAVTGFLGELDTISGGVREMKIAILRQSEKRMWKFVFPIKDEKSIAQPGGQTPAALPRVSHIELRDGEEVVVFD